jgi:glycine cleavage system aminomethyltransferase T
MTVMAALLRRHGATVVERHGRSVAVDFGSAAAEAAVCRSGVGLAERSDRATLEVRGPHGDLDRALDELSGFGGRVSAQRVGAGRALVRCDGDLEGACSSAMLRAPDVEVRQVSGDCTALELIGPLAADVLLAAALEDGEPVVALREGDAGIELLVARPHGPALWNRLLAAGEPHGIALVGLDALEHLTVSEHVDHIRRPAPASVSVSPSASASASAG